MIVIIVSAILPVHAHNMQGSFKEATQLWTQSQGLVSIHNTVTHNHSCERASAFRKSSYSSGAHCKCWM